MSKDSENNQKINRAKYLICNRYDLTPENMGFILDLFKSLNETDKNELKILLSDSESYINTMFKSGNTYLRMAYEKNNYELAKLFIECGADINIVYKSVGALIHEYTIEQDVVNIKSLIENKADVNLEDKEGRTPLSISISKENSNNVIKTLLDNGADINLKDKEGRTPLYQALIKMKSNYVKILINKGANFDDIDTKDIVYVLFKFVKEGCYSLAEIVLEKAKIKTSDNYDINSFYTIFLEPENLKKESFKGYKDYLIKLGILEIQNWLLKQDYEIFSDFDTQQLFELLPVRIQKRDLRYVQDLIKKDKFVISKKNSEGNTILDLVFLNGGKITKQEKEIIKFLLDNGADLKVLSNRASLECQYRLLIKLVKKENLEFFKYLIDKNLKVDFKNTNSKNRDEFFTESEIRDKFFEELFSEKNYKTQEKREKYFEFIKLLIGSKDLVSAIKPKYVPKLLDFMYQYDKNSELPELIANNEVFREAINVKGQILEDVFSDSRGLRCNDSKQMLWLKTALDCKADINIKIKKFCRDICEIIKLYPIEFNITEKLTPIFFEKFIKDSIKDLKQVSQIKIKVSRKDSKNKIVEALKEAHKNGDEVMKCLKENFLGSDEEFINTLGNLVDEEKNDPNLAIN